MSADAGCQARSQCHPLNQAQPECVAENVLIGVEQLLVVDPASGSELVGAEGGLPGKVLRSQAPDVAADEDLAPPLLDVVEVAGQLSEVEALLINLSEEGVPPDRFPPEASVCRPAGRPRPCRIVPPGILC